jgi:hypothetical protein
MQYQYIGIIPIPHDYIIVYRINYMNTNWYCCRKAFEMPLKCFNLAADRRLENDDYIVHNSDSSLTRTESVHQSFTLKTLEFWTEIPFCMAEPFQNLLATFSKPIQNL